MTEYQEFLQSKTVAFQPTGKDCNRDDIHPMLFDFQRDITLWAVRKGRAAIFADTGMGKTLMQLEWARLIGEKTLIIAPLSVARQTSREANKIGLDVPYVRSQDEVTGNISITNYEMIDQFDMSQFGAVVLDESSILKALAGKTRKKLTKLCATVPYRLCCTATPAPNDYTELGNHVEFLGICKATEMLAMFFINANHEHTIYIDDVAYRKKGSNKGGQEWRLKHHAEEPFFRWMATWAMAITKPSDLGYDDDGFILPELRVHPHFMRVDYQPDDQLFFTHIKGIRDASRIRRDTAGARLTKLQEIMALANNELLGEQWVIWCGLNDEQKLVEDALGDRCVVVDGSLSLDEKIKRLDSWLNKEKQILVSKPSVLGYGLNLQQAHKMAFFGLNYSWEQYYQCIRREWRYRQEYPVDVHVIMSDVEESVYKNIMRKDAQAKRLRGRLIEMIGAHERGELEFEAPAESLYRNLVDMEIPAWL